MKQQERLFAGLSGELTAANTGEPLLYAMIGKDRSGSQPNQPGQFDFRNR